MAETLEPGEPRAGVPLARGLARLARAFLDYAGLRALWAGLLMAGAAIFEGLGLALVAPLLAVVAGGPSGRYSGVVRRLFAEVGVRTPTAELGLLLVAFSSLMLVRAFVVRARDMASARLQAGFVEDQQMRIAARVAAAPWERVARLRHARVTHLVSGEIMRVSVMTQFLLQCCIAALMLAVQAALVFALAPQLALPLVGLMALAALALVPMARRAHRVGREIGEESFSLVDSASQFLGGLKLAVSQNLQGAFLAEYRLSLDRLTGQRIAFVSQQSTGRTVFATVSALAAAAIVFLGFAVFHIAAATLIALLAIIARMAGPLGQLQIGVQQLAHVLPAWQSAQALEAELEPHPPAYGRSRSSLRSPNRWRGRAASSPATEKAAARTAGRRHEGQTEVRPSSPFMGEVAGRRPDGGGPQGPIVFEGVTFLHTAESGEAAARGVQDVSLTLRPGEFVGVAGPSGAGKTTLADLLVGLLEPQAGRITVAGEPLAGPRLAAWRGEVSYVAQDPFLFHDTLRRNLAWASPGAGEAEMWEALAFAGAEALVRSLPGGLDAVAGERGTLVSGGERQRIALARAILRRPSLLVLDEATGAIDVAGERALLERLKALSPRPTIVLIAHRPESLAICERLIAVADGRAPPAADGERPDLKVAARG